MLLFQVVFGFFAFLGVFVAGGLLCKTLGVWVFLVLPLLFGLVAVGVFGARRRAVR
ncbi:hypothetical protein [Megalodesulfovibrio gigas]|uniref:Uncharacterized protein n=1 Tax=Megalodesulfovibrio gigas (strain ATCC 19364 / DSM 1382 / NCIMB 9332 / VKM B-1759) TaxID=1121448 RepID=T2G972_MEGG1|nr:hypothetical protein [Megalodesulfovibrio gigas]AGW12843.1 hypothetical protein DGI_0959 [Megalodesulfovibrio gigas DSM 1382 = ATCC 19364]